MKKKIQFFLEDKLVKEYTMAEGESFSVGREDCTINLPEDDLVSRQHFWMEIKHGVVYIKDDSKNGLFLGDKKLKKGVTYELRAKQRLVIGDGRYSAILVSGFDGILLSSPKKKAITVGKIKRSAKVSMRGGIEIKPKKRIVIEGVRKERSIGGRLAAMLERKGIVSIGRDPSCDLQLASLLISRKHAEIRQVGGEALIYDYSKNGVFINGKRIEKSAYIGLKDEISIGPFKFSIAGEVVDYTTTNEPAIVANRIKKVYKNGYVGLQQMSMKVPTSEFVALMGPSGCGKSTLLRCLNGDNPSTEGTVMIQGLELNSENFDLLKRNIGYVPQDDIVHRGLSVEDTMYYAAKLRLADDVTDEEIVQRINKVLKDLNIDDTELRKNKVGELSGGQRKRVSIAVELLNEPSILFLDEPTSPLDPETIDDFLTRIRNLAKEGTTIIMVTHKPSDLIYTDTVIFLAKGGFLTYYDDSKKIYDHFKLGKGEIIKIYSLLSDQDAGRSWYRKWSMKHESTTISTSGKTLSKLRTDSLWRQYFWLSKRYLKIKWNDKGNMLLLLAQPFIIAGLIAFIFKYLQIGVLFLMAIASIWFGVSNAAKEIVAELPIYKRERMFNVDIWTYLSSKITVLSFIAFIQVVIFVGIIFMAYNIENSEPNITRIVLYSYWKNVWFMFFLSISSTLLGLLLSAVFTNTEKVMTFVPIALIPQIMLAGVVAKIEPNIKELLSYLTLGRWGTEGFSWIQDSDAKNETNFFYSNNTNGIDTTAESVVILVPDGVGGRKTEPAEAIEIIEFYPSDSMAWFDSLGGNILAITLLNILVLICLYLALKQKDSI